MLRFAEPRALDPSAASTCDDARVAAHDGAARRIPNRTAFAPTLLVDELARCGVRAVCVSPGSRSAPLVSALVAHGGLQLWSHVDERCAGFFALGLARASRTPVAIVCTSGTAVANLLPPVIEAFHARVPLLLLTADRPPELRDCGAGQTIDQHGLFGTHVRWTFDLGTPDATVEAARHVRAIACRAVAVARGDTGAPPGPVHLNLPFREPLDPREVSGDVAASLLRTAAVRGRGAADGAASVTSSAATTASSAPSVAWTRSAHAQVAPDADALEDVARLLRAARRPLVVAGWLDDGDVALVPAVAGLCAALRAPLLADVASNLRRGPALAYAVDAHDAVTRALLADDAAPDDTPDAIVRIGAMPTAKALATWLARRDDVLQVVIDPAATWADPGSVASHLVVGAPAVVCASLAARVATLRALAGVRRGDGDARDAWLARWRDAGRRARAALDDAVAMVRTREGCSTERAAATVFEAHAVATLARALPSGATLYAGNSLAVRAVDAFWPLDAAPARVLVNRGANGIDGFVSSVLGAAASDPSRATVGVCGDLTFYHDLNGLLAVRRHGVRALFVVLNNDGGGIFDHLPIAAYRDGYEEHFATPTGLDFQPVVEMYGARFTRVTDPSQLAPAIEDGLACGRAAVVELRYAREAARAAWEEARARAVRAAAQEAARDTVSA